MDINFGTRPGPASFDLPMSKLSRHVLYLGPTGVGKTRCMRHVAMQLAGHGECAVVVICPKGDLYHGVRRDAYDKHFDRRVILVNPAEERLICGFNPLRPWRTGNRSLQAAVAVDIFLRALGTRDAFAVAPQMTRWLRSNFYAGLFVGSTLHEAPMLFDFTDPRLRNAVTERLPEGDVKSDFLWLAQLLANSTQGQVMRLVQEQLGSSVNRLRQFTRNDSLRLMLATQDRAIEWRQAINNRSIVLVNGFEGDVLAREDQRTLCMQVLSEVIRECFRREEGGEPRIPVHIFIDEAHRFVSPEVELVLNEGRSFGCVLHLGLQSLTQLVDAENQDRRLLESVLTNTRLKIIFGGLPYRSAEEVAWDIYGSRLDPDKRKLELKSWVQLHHLELMKSYGHSIGHATSQSHAMGMSTSRGITSMRSRSHAHGTSSASGAGSASSFGAGYSSGDHSSYDHESELVGTGDGLAVSTSSQSAQSNFSMEGEMDVEAHGEGDGEIEMVGESELVGTSEAESRTHSVSVGPVVVPDGPFEHVSSVQFEPLAEQLHRCVATMIGQPPQHATAAADLDPPVQFRVAEVPDATVDTRLAHHLDLDIMRALPFYTRPEVIQEEIAERLGRLLHTSTPAPVEVLEAIQSRRRLMNGVEMRRRRRTA